MEFELGGMTLLLRTITLSSSLLPFVTSLCCSGLVRAGFEVALSSFFEVDFLRASLASSKCPPSGCPLARLRLRSSFGGGTALYSGHTGPGCCCARKYASRAAVSACCRVTNGLSGGWIDRGPDEAVCVEDVDLARRMRSPALLFDLDSIFRVDRRR